MIKSIEKALKVAVDAHTAQVDKAGEPYVFHPIRMMLRADKESEKIVALLHDVVEDSPTTLMDLRNMGFQEKFIRSVDALTKREHESYDQFIRRASTDTVARKVKILDLEDNMNLLRLKEFTDKDSERMKRYLSAYRYLNKDSKE